MRSEVFASLLSIEGRRMRLLSKAEAEAAILELKIDELTNSRVYIKMF